MIVDQRGRRVVLAFGRDRDRRHGRPRAARCTASLTVRMCCSTTATSSSGRPHGGMGSVHHAGDHGKPRHREVCRGDRRQDDDRAGRRSDGHRPARRHRESRSRRQEGRSASPPDPARERVGRSRPLHAGAGRSALGRGRCAGAGRRRSGPCQPRVAKTRDITGGLPRVAELFEARKPKENAIIAKVSGRVVFGKDYKAKRKIGSSPDGGEVVEYLVPKSKVIDVQEGDYVKRGDNLIGGSPDPHDILEVLGIEPLAEYLVSEIQEVYRLQGVKINDKHIEVIVRQMLQKVEITESAATPRCWPGEQVDRDEMDEQNASSKKGRTRRRASRSCSASPRRRCRPAASSRRRRSRRPPASSPRRRSRASRTR
jgi:hypothetical protein